MRLITAEAHERDALMNLQATDYSIAIPVLVRSITHALDPCQYPFRARARIVIEAR